MRKLLRQHKEPFEFAHEERGTRHLVDSSTKNRKTQGTSRGLRRHDLAGRSSDGEVFRCWVFFFLSE